MTSVVKEAASGEATGDRGSPDADSCEGDAIVARAGGTPDEPRAPHRRRRRRWTTLVLAVVAVAGLAGTTAFGIAWERLHAQQAGEAHARAAARSFLVDLTNFSSKTVDADFAAVTTMSTGPFASQAKRFFNSAIRQELQRALASSRGQIRALYVESYGGGQATVYGVVDQLYANAKLSAPRTDVLRLVVTLDEVAGHWKVADVTVLQGPSPVSGTASPTTTSPGAQGSPGAPAHS